MKKGQFAKLQMTLTASKSLIFHFIHDVSTSGLATRFCTTWQVVTMKAQQAVCLNPPFDVDCNTSHPVEQRMTINQPPVGVDQLLSPIHPIIITT